MSDQIIQTLPLAQGPVKMGSGKVRATDIFCGAAYTRLLIGANILALGAHTARPQCTLTRICANRKFAQADVWIGGDGLAEHVAGKQRTQQQLVVHHVDSAK